jgi:hypothetical protein
MERKRRLAWIGGIAGLVFLGLFLGRGRLIGLWLGSVLEEEGASCGGLSVLPDWDLSAIELGPLTCSLAEGPIASLSLGGGADVTFSGALALPARRVTIPRLTFNPRGAGPEEDPGQLGAALLAGEVPPALGEALVGLAALARRDDLPAVSIETVAIGRGRVLELRDVRVEPGAERLAIAVASLGPPTRSLAPLTLSVGIVDLSIEARPDAVDVRGTLRVEAQAAGRAHALLLDVERDVPFTITSRGLDEGAPSHRLELGASAALDRLRERLLQVLDDTEEPDERAVGLRMLRERLARRRAP